MADLYRISYIEQGANKTTQPSRYRAVIAGLEVLCVTGLADEAAKAGSLADKVEMVGSPDKGGIQAAIVDHLDRVVQI